MSYKSTNHIFAHPYEIMPANLNYFELPTYSSQDICDFTKIEMWQQIYYKPGFIGVYAAYTPKVELYMITYNMFLKEKKGYELFSGNNAVEHIVDRCNSLGVHLEKTTEEK